MIKVVSDEWRAFIQDAANQLGIKVHRRQAEQFALHAHWLLEWNRKINLTSITDPRDMAIKHFIDAIAPMEHIPDTGRLLDIGTGGGFPGIPLKIMRPWQPMTLIDSVRKKVNFVRHVIRQIPLEGIEALHIRAEALADTIHADERFDVIVCRALSDPTAAIALSRPLLAPGGKIVLYLGPGSAEGAEHESNDHIKVDEADFQYSSISYPLPFSHFTRRIFLIQNQD